MRFIGCWRRGNLANIADIADKKDISDITDKDKGKGGVSTRHTAFLAGDIRRGGLWDSGRGLADGQLEDGVAGGSLVFEDVEAGGYAGEVQTVGVIGCGDSGTGEAVESGMADGSAEEHGIVGSAVPGFEGIAADIADSACGEDEGGDGTFRSAFIVDSFDAGNMVAVGYTREFAGRFGC